MKIGQNILSEGCFHFLFKGEILFIPSKILEDFQLDIVSIFEEENRKIAAKIAKFFWGASPPRPSIPKKISRLGGKK